MGAPSESVVSQTQLHGVLLPWVAFTSLSSDSSSAAWGLCHLVFEIPAESKVIILVNI